MSNFKSREKLKEDIVEFLEEKAEEGDILSLDEGELKDRFTNDYYDEKSIEEIIEELEENNIVENEDIYAEILIPSKHEDELRDNLKDYFRISSSKKLTVGFLLTLILIEWDKFLELLVAEGSKWPAEEVRGTLVLGFIVSYAIGAFAFFANSKIEEKSELVREYSKIIAPALGLPLVALASLLGIRSFYPGLITPTVIATIVGPAIGAGIGLGIYLDKE